MAIENFLLLFETNNIKLTKNELISLFKNTTYKKIYLDFYHFCAFTLKHENEFRIFMRKLSEKQKKLNKNENSNYFPRSFNLLLDYFLAMGEERKCVNKIQAKIDNMKNIQKIFPNKIDDVEEFVNENKKFNFKEILYEFKKLISMVCNEKNYFNLKLNEKLNKYNKNNSINNNNNNNFSKKSSKSIDYNEIVLNNIMNEKKNKNINKNINNNINNNVNNNINNNNFNSNHKINKKNSFYDKKSISSKKLDFSHSLNKYLNNKSLNPFQKQSSKKINEKKILFQSQKSLKSSFNYDENNDNNNNNKHFHTKLSNKKLPKLKQSKSIDFQNIVNFNFLNINK